MSITYQVTVDQSATIWRLDGVPHRENGPAIEYSDGDQRWYRNSRLHREDGPAIEYTNGHKEWYQNGRLHREDGPAVVYANGNKYWYLNGEELSKDEFNARMNPTKEMTLVEIERLLGYPVKVVK